MSSNEVPQAPPSESGTLRDQPGSSHPATEANTSRRSFLTRVGGGAVLVALAGQTYAFLRSLVPNVLYEEPPRFKVGTPDQFPEGVSFLDDRRVFIVREKNTFQAMSAVCTHLGCTVKFRRFDRAQTGTGGGAPSREQQEFLCPCHGSKYRGDGTPYAGPAPRPLPFFRVEVSPDDGQLIVDASEETDREFRVTV
ncbi:MAG: Rieske (2Fe-2S) protein [Acidobacteria bacterium]|nr:MAG: Rieske (2Fe-2S) protein [Acidobacteriota bacterium]